MYLAARGWGIQPSEFWDMTLGEFMLEASLHAEHAQSLPPTPGKLTPDELQRLRVMMPGSE